MLRSARYDGLEASSLRASIAARGSSKKTNTKPELLLRTALWRKGLRYQKNRRDLPGVPDLVFVGCRLVVFVDGDFWHGKDWNRRKIKLSHGHNADYWLTKIKGNIQRDLDQNRKLRKAGWTVVRVWESEIRSNIKKIVNRIESMVASTRE